MEGKRVGLGTRLKETKETINSQMNKRELIDYCIENEFIKVIFCIIEGN